MVLFRRKGRKMGGLHVLFGKPGDGKSYIAMVLGHERMERGQKVFSNFPIVDLYQKHISYYFDKSLMTENLTKSVVIVDEAHKEFWSRDFKNFTEGEKNWFNMLGHNQISVYVVTQDVANIDVIINRAAMDFMLVEKTEIPILEIPLWFTVRTYLTLEDVKFSHISDRDLSVSKERFWFRQNLADTYDTTFFRVQKKELYIGETWVERYDRLGIAMELPKPTWLQKRRNEISEVVTYIMRKIKEVYLKYKYGKQRKEKDEELEKLVKEELGEE